MGSDEACPVLSCMNPAQPPENWPSCFYDGSPCQREPASVSQEDDRDVGGVG